MRERITELVECVTDRWRPWAHMEELTGISARRWQNVAQGRQRASDEMISALGAKWPRYAYWLVTGLTDEPHGHTSPTLDRYAQTLNKGNSAR